MAIYHIASNIGSLITVERSKLQLRVKKMGVVGVGLLGLECANALKNLGLETHVVEFAPGLMDVQLD